MAVLESGESPGAAVPVGIEPGPLEVEDAMIILPD
jgi:hypothetical protein